MEYKTRVSYQGTDSADLISGAAAFADDSAYSPVSMASCQNCRSCGGGCYGCKKTDDASTGRSAGLKSVVESILNE
jgi:hypothetical protein